MTNNNGKINATMKTIFMAAALLMVTFIPMHTSASGIGDSVVQKVDEPAMVDLLNEMVETTGKSTKIHTLRDSTNMITTYDVQRLDDK